MNKLSFMLYLSDLLPSIGVAFGIVGTLGLIAGGALAAFGTFCHSTYEGQKEHAYPVETHTRKNLLDVEDQQ